MNSRYDCKAISKLWSDKIKYQTWCEIEFAALKALKNITITYTITENDVQEIQEIEKTTKHDVGAFVKWLENKFNDQPWSRFIHYGLTSSDIVDTAFSLTLYNVNCEIHTLVLELIKTITEIYLPNQNVKIVGRTHGQIAEITTLKQKLWNYIDNLSCLIPTLVAPRGKLAGAVGTNSFFSQTCASQALSTLGMLNSNCIDGQVISRHYFAKNVLNWALLAAYIEKIATDLRLLAQTEIGEISEGFSKGQIGSSSMPHKRNPISLENICGNARIIKNYASAALDTIVIWNERDISHSSMERTIYPEASILLGYIIERLTSTLKNMNFNTEVMNTRATEAEEKFANSQKMMLQSIDAGKSRSEAHKEQSEKV